MLLHREKAPFGFVLFCLFESSWELSELQVHSDFRLPSLASKSLLGTEGFALYATVAQ